ncbi:MAG: hypothetical protein HYX90_06990 [Chloroflexi bacterium]|nr:hypothetical protein [Chloroflexota bacterium]
MGPSSLMGKPGAVGFASQSGGHALKMAETGANIGIGYSKMVSYGNGADLEAADFIQYFAADPRTEIVSAYLEGCRDGRRLFEAIRVASSSKPVVVWKGGQSRQGAEAAASHTGSLVASVDMWRAALAQAGAVPVRDMEELADTLLLFQQVKTLKGLRVGIVCGLTDGGGGESVLSADHCAAHGIEVPRFSPQARQILSALFGEIGSVLRNPLDVSQAGGGVDKIRQGLEVVVSEQHLDAIIVYENADIIARFLPQGRLEEINRAVLDFAAKSKKPTVVVLPPGGNDRVWLETREALLKEGVAVFPSTDRAARAMANVRAYSASAGR